MADKIYVMRYIVSSPFTTSGEGCVGWGSFRANSPDEVRGYYEELGLLQHKFAKGKCRWYGAVEYTFNLTTGEKKSEWIEWHMAPAAKIAYELNAVAKQELPPPKNYFVEPMTEDDEEEENTPPIPIEDIVPLTTPAPPVGGFFTSAATNWTPSSLWASVGVVDTMPATPVNFNQTTTTDD